jgi:hypothetical protein
MYAERGGQRRMFRRGLAVALVLPQNAIATDRGRMVKPSLLLSDGRRPMVASAQESL